MLRRILLALDGTPGGHSARDAALALARRTGAALTCAAVLDRPHTGDAAEAMPPGAMAFAERRNAALAAQAEAAAQSWLEAAKLAAGTLPITTATLPEAPQEALLRAGAAHDLVVLGRECTLGQEQVKDGIAPVIQALLHHGARPLLVVPPGVTADEAGRVPARTVLVAYDGSPPAMRVIQLFALLGLAEESPVKVVSARPEMEAAAQLAGEGAAYLRQHGVSAEAWPLAGGDPAELLLGEASDRDVRLLVMGAFGTSGLRAFLLGSVTRSLLRDCPCTMFVHH
jgi:nucleotide-binding universal stress UspA family protein